MPSLIDENTQFVDTDGKPIVGGSIYIGTQNADPVANPITIYSDRDLTVSITNPQTTDANGRATNKIWVPGKYSIQVNNSAAVQKYQELDAGELSQTGISQLVNVQGTNTITADGSPVVTALVDGQQYNFRAANTNTGAVTLQIDLTAAKAIKKLHDNALVAGDFEQNQIVSVVYNATDDVFELVSNVSSINFTDVTVAGNLKLSKGADLTTADVIAGALSLGTDGNYFDFTGTDTITSINTVAVGFTVTIHFDAAATLTHHATDLTLPGGANIVTAAGDEAEFIEYALGDWRCTNYERASGESVVATSLLSTVSGHVRAGNIQLVTGAVTSRTNFTFSSLIAAGTPESIGPTGSGATNIWADMDDIPSTARIGIFELNVKATASGAGIGGVVVYACEGDTTLTVDVNDNAIFEQGMPASQRLETQNMVFIPLNASLVFNLDYAEVNLASNTSLLIYRGFINDS